MNIFVSQEKLEEVAALAAMCGDSELESWCDQALDGSEEANALVLRVLQKWCEWNREQDKQKMRESAKCLT